MNINPSLTLLLITTSAKSCCEMALECVFLFAKLKSYCSPEKLSLLLLCFFCFYLNFIFYIVFLPLSLSSQLLLPFFSHFFSLTPNYNCSANFTSLLYTSHPLLRQQCYFERSRQRSSGRENERERPEVTELQRDTNRETERNREMRKLNSSTGGNEK